MNKLGYGIAAGIAAAALAVSGCSVGSTQASGKGTVKSAGGLQTPHTIKQAAKQANLTDPPAEETKDLKNDKDIKMLKSMFDAEDMSVYAKSKSNPKAVVLWQTKDGDSGKRMVKTTRQMMNKDDNLYALNIDGDGLVAWVEGKKFADELHDELHTSGKPHAPKGGGKAGSESPDPAESSSSGEDQSENRAELKAGGSFEWEDGLKVELKRGNTAVATDDDAEMSGLKAGQKFMMYTFTVTNDTGEDVNLTPMIDAVYDDHGEDKDAKEIVSIDALDGKDLDGTVRDGQTRSGQVAFDLDPDAKGVVLSFDAETGGDEHMVDFVGK